MSLLKIMWLVGLISQSIYPTFITSQKHGGRLGDCIINYIKAKFLARKYNLTFLHRPFHYSDQFILHNIDVHLNNFRFRGIISISNEEQLKKELKKNHKDLVLESHYWTRLNNMPQKQVIDHKGDATEGLYDYAIEHPQFHDDLLKCLQPRLPYSKITLPEECITIAVHVRKGTGFDSPLSSVQIYQKPSKLIPNTPKKRSFADCGFPTKFPPDQYYIDHIILLAEALSNVHLFVYIFTDDPDPIKIVHRYKRAVNKTNITWGCRKSDNAHNKHVIEDLFNMAFHFDCLIRSSSSFGWAAQFIGNHKLIISPLRGTWHQDMLIMDAVELVIPNKSKHQVARYIINHLDFHPAYHIIANTLH